MYLTDCLIVSVGTVYIKWLTDCSHWYCTWNDRSINSVVTVSLNDVMIAIIGNVIERLIDWYLPIGTGGIGSVIDLPSPINVTAVHRESITSEAIVSLEEESPVPTYTVPTLSSSYVPRHALSCKMTQQENPAPPPLSSSSHDGRCWRGEGCWEAGTRERMLRLLQHRDCSVADGCGGPDAGDGRDAERGREEEEEDDIQSTADAAGCSLRSQCIHYRRQHMYTPVHDSCDKYNI